MVFSQKHIYRLPDNSRDVLPKPNSREKSHQLEKFPRTRDELPTMAALLAGRFVVVVVGSSMLLFLVAYSRYRLYDVKAMESIKKLHFLFILLVMATIALVLLVYDMHDDYGTNSSLKSFRWPEMMSAGVHSSSWSLADYGFDSSLSPSTKELFGTEDNEMKAWNNSRAGIKSKGRNVKKRKRKKKRKQYMKQAKRQASEGTKAVDLNELRKRLPNAIIIGSKKCGTRALLKQLGFHSRIVTAGREMHFFDRNFDKGYEWYREQMPLSSPEELTIEKTPAYFISKQTPERIYGMEKKFSIYVKFIVIVRDPVKRAISDYAQGLYRASKKKRKRQSFEEKVFTSPNEKKVNRSAYFIRIGLYAKHLRKWLRFFNLSQMHFVSGEQLISRPWEELEAVQKFLNVSVEITKENFWYNSTKKFYCIREKDADVIPKCLGETKGRKHPDIDHTTVRALRKFYKPFNREFYKMAKRDFGWPE